MLTGRPQGDVLTSEGISLSELKAADRREAARLTP
jgi:hypothetical protein